MKNRHLALISATVVTVGLGALVAGCGGILASSATTQTSTQTSTQNQNATAPSISRIITGTITASDASSVTVKTAKGGTQTVALADSTKISVTRDGTAADLVPGKTAAVLVTTNPNNSRSASQVHVGVTLPQGPGHRSGHVVYGTITASDASSLTIQVANGGTQTIALTGSTKIVVTTDGSAADLAAGKNVVILATRGADKSLTASRIQVGVNLPQGMSEGRSVPPRGNRVPRGGNGWGSGSS
jgi:hypothetical protein